MTLEVLGKLAQNSESDQQSFHADSKKVGDVNKSEQAAQSTIPTTPEGFTKPAESPQQEPRNENSTVEADLKAASHRRQPQNEIESSSDSPKGLEKTITLLKEPDDTSRFVGLAMLKSILDNDEALQKNTQVIERCWAAIPGKFLDRLLASAESGKKSEEESDNLIGLAVSVLHVFHTLLPGFDREEDVGKGIEKFYGRIPSLLRALQFRYGMPVHFFRAELMTQPFKDDRPDS